MSSFDWPSASERQVPFAGHPLGGLPRDDRFNAADLIRPLVITDVVEEDVAGGFDFHLGVYARF